MPHSLKSNNRRWHSDHLAFGWRQGLGIETGTTFWLRERIEGTPLEKEVRIVEVVAGRYFAFAPTWQLMRVFLPRMSYAFWPEPAGFVLEAEVHLRGIGPLGRRLNRREFAAMERHVAQAGQNLTALLESGSPYPACRISRPGLNHFAPQAHLEGRDERNRGA